MLEAILVWQSVPNKIHSFTVFNYSYLSKYPDEIRIFWKQKDRIDIDRSEESTDRTV